MIELAPGHKQGLPVSNPVLIAGGMIGYGEAVARGTDVSQLGGVVIGPILANSRGGAPLPRVAHTPGGLVLETGLQNRGIASAIRQHGKLWPKLGCPVVAQIADNDPRGMGKLAARIATAAGIVGLELLPLTRELEVAARMVRAAAQVSDLPVWVKVSLADAVAWAPRLVGEGANGLVVGQPPLGQLDIPGQGPVNGSLYGPLTFALMLPVLRAVAGLQLSAALIACGGIHTAGQMAQALDAGARAIQVDSGVWVEPALPNWLATAWHAQGDPPVA